MKYPVMLLLIGSCLLACTDTMKDNVEESNVLQSMIKGTWKLVSAKHIIKGDTVEKLFPEKIEGIKIIGDTHFSFFQHDLKKGKDSLAYYSSGAGKYVLEGNQYIEYLEYCSGREWESRKFEFTVTVAGDSLVQTGVERIPSLDVDRTIIETYIKANNENTPVPVQSDFDEEEIAWFKQKGSGSISGLAKFKSREGEVRFGDQFVVELMPVGSYTVERLGRIYGNPDSGSVYLQDGIPRFIPDPEAYHTTIKTVCDAEGRFEFTNLPKGEYYAIAFMIWDEEEKGKLGGGIMRRVNLAEGVSETLEMVNF